MKRLRTVILGLLLFAGFHAFTQVSSTSDKAISEAIKTTIDEKHFDEFVLNAAIVDAINNERQKNDVSKLDTNAVLSKASSDYASYLASIDDSKPGLGGKKQTASYRLKMYSGAANDFIEICLKTTLKKGKESQSYSDLANDIVFKWFNSKSAEDLKSPEYLLIGLASKTESTNKKVYISVMLGSYSTLNAGQASVKTSGMQISVKNPGLKPYDSKICKSCEKFKNIDTLQRALTVDGPNIILETQLKFIKRIIKNPNDGIAIDIVSKKQYPCNGENIVDKSLPSKGLLTKKITQSKLMKLNQCTGKDAKTKFKAIVGQIPAGMSDYELNLVVFQDKIFCKNIRPSYTEFNQTATKSRLKILGDTISFYSDFEYKPTPDTTFLTFKIPFELGKSNYNSEDIKPLIEALKEPDFIITGLKITAFSSIEGREEKNDQLRLERAQNIVKAFKQMQKGNPIDAEVVSSDSWKIFFQDIKGTEWDSLRKKSPDYVREIILKNKLEAKLETILTRERFARVEMKVIYDLGSIQKEQGFVLKKFHQALDSSDIVKALNIQKYIIKKVRRGLYSKYIIPQMQIPLDSARFAGMQMNNLWLDYIVNSKAVDSAFYFEVCRLSKLDAKNEYIIYNKLFCEIKLFDLTDEAYVSVMQQKVDALRTSKLRKSDVDPLTIELQIKIIESIGNTLKVADEQKMIQETLNRIKGVFDLRTGDWKRALNLAALFMQMGDFEYPITLLEPFVMNTDADERVLFTYLSACTHSEFKPNTKQFEQALQQAFQKNKTRTCNLFKNGQMSFQLLENPNVKKMVCEQCGL
jgi:uncharacterized protein YkwD